MKRAWALIRSFSLWTVSWLHFAIDVPVLIALAVFLDPRKYDWLQRSFCRRIALFSGARVQVVRSPGFDPHRTCFFMANHVNLFDPFILYNVIPQLVRGWELESHFKIPIYGWLMKRFGNVPVPDVRRPSDLKRMWRLTKEAIDSGTSLIIFPEAKRTRDGRVGAFEEGGFRVAQQLGIPVVPVSLVGSYQHLRTGSWLLQPALITIHLHDTIETKDLTKEDVSALSKKVRTIISAPIDSSLANSPQETAATAEFAEPAK
jgi:1-acyl-sn-glycerol-3-phosphate acyltransferase